MIFKAFPKIFDNFDWILKEFSECDLLLFWHFGVVSDTVFLGTFLLYKSVFFWFLERGDPCGCGVDFRG